MRSPKRLKRTKVKIRNEVQWMLLGGILLAIAVALSHDPPEKPIPFQDQQKVLIQEARDFVGFLENMKEAKELLPASKRIEKLKARVGTYQNWNQDETPLSQTAGTSGK